MLSSYLNYMFVFKFVHDLLPSAFNFVFTAISSGHTFNSRLTSKSEFCIPSVKTNYSKFNVRLQGVVLWNNIDESLKNHGFTNLSIP